MKRDCFVIDEAEVAIEATADLLRDLRAALRTEPGPSPYAAARTLITVNEVHERLEYVHKLVSHQS